MITDELSGKARELKKKHGSLSIVFLQRKLQIGYKQAKELIEKVTKEMRLKK